MSIFEYDKELEEKKIRKAEYEFGYSEGHANGIVEGIEKGRAEGVVETGYDFGLSDENIQMKLQEKLNISEQKAKEYLALYGKRFR